jgi:small-conductance mechanosensitive channel
MENAPQVFTRAWLATMPDKLFYALCVLVAFYLVSWLVNLWLRVALRPAIQASKHPDPTVRAGRGRMLLRTPRNVSRAVLYTIAVLVAMKVLGVELYGVILPVLFAGFAMAIVACRGILKDAVRGYVLVLQDAFAIGDEVTLGATRGTVTRVGLLNTQLRTADGADVTVANGGIDAVINHSRGGNSEQTPTP